MIKMKKLNEVYYRVIELPNKERVVVVPKVREIEDITKTKKLVLEDFHHQSEVYLINLSTTSNLRQQVDINYDSYKLKKANPLEQVAIANLKRETNKALAQAKNAHRQLIKQQELFHQLNELEHKINENKKQMNDYLGNVRTLTKGCELIASDFIIAQRFEDPNRELIDYQFYDSKKGNANLETAKYLLRHTNKPIYLREGFAYRGARLKEVTREDALKAISGEWADIKELDDRVTVNTYSANDMW